MFREFGTYLVIFRPVSETPAATMQPRQMSGW
ncbi:hypothetical protein GBAR_LOCUS12355 [Geodia barretti]|uniref:Uncharacterized protein n=1 Tax=Geodia barretti TaxID=519541 RepID=A0AA35WNA7_GEOBA|nr:hypothetical protein GBAR_LOCUS12355 [Geodia barretti]